MFECLETVVGAVQRASRELRFVLGCVLWGAVAGTAMAQRVDTEVRETASLMKSPARRLPLVSILPESGTHLTSSAQWVTVTACDNNGIVDMTLSVNGVPATLVDGPQAGCPGTAYGAEVTLQAGSNTLEASACNSLGDCGYATSYVYVDLYGLSVTSGSAVDLNVGSSGSVTFEIRNTGNAAGTVTLTPICPAYLTGCGSGQTITLALTHTGSTPYTFSVSFIASDSGHGGVGLAASYAEDANAGGSGFVSVTAARVPVYSITVTPVNPSMSVVAQTYNTAGFVVTNNGDLVGSLSFSGSCSGAALAACPSSGTIPNLQPNTSTQIGAGFDALTAGSGTVSVSVSFDASPATAQSASTAVTVSAPVYSLSMYVLQPTPSTVPQGVPTLAYFRLTNGPTSAGVSLSPSCSTPPLVPQACSVSEGSLNLQPGESRDVWVAFETWGEGNATVGLTATVTQNPSVTAVQSIPIYSSYNPQVAPRVTAEQGAVSAMPDNVERETWFTVSTSTSDVREVRWTLSCGSLFAGSCRLGPLGTEPQELTGSAWMSDTTIRISVLYRPTCSMHDLTGVLTLSARAYVMNHDSSAAVTATAIVGVESPPVSDIFITGMKSLIAPWERTSARAVTVNCLSQQTADTVSWPWADSLNTNPQRFTLTRASATTANIAGLPTSAPAYGFFRASTGNVKSEWYRMDIDTTHVSEVLVNVTPTQVEPNGTAQATWSAVSTRGDTINDVTLSYLKMSDTTKATIDSNTGVISVKAIPDALLPTTDTVILNVDGHQGYAVILIDRPRVIWQVQPHLQADSVPIAQQRLLNFIVKNTGNIAGVATASLSCPRCSALPWTTREFAVGDSVVVPITFTGRATSGIDTVRFSVATDTITSSGSFVMESYDASSPLDLRISTTQEGVTQERSACYRIALDEDAAMECGALRVRYALPSVTTMGREHSLALTYNSAHAIGVVNLALDVRVHGYAPDSFIVKVKYGGVTRATQRFRTDTLCDGRWCRLNLPITAAATGLSTGRYQLAIDVEARRGTQSYVRTDSVRVVMIYRNPSDFGAGWWLEGLETLRSLSANEFLWIGGDGSTRVFTQRTASVWTSDVSVTRADSLIKTTDAGYPVYRRKLPNGAFAEFDGYTWLHRRTVSTEGWATTFYWDGSHLVRIVLPQSVNVWTYPGYTFNWNYSADGYIESLSSISATGQWATEITFLGSWLSTLSGPRGGTSFSYSGWNQLVGRSRRGGLGERTYTFDPGFGLRSSSAQVSFLRYAVSSFCPSVTRGITSCTTTDTGTWRPILRDSVYTSYIAPNMLVFRQMAWVNAFGAPDSVETPDGRVRIYHNELFRALVDSTISVTGVRRVARYNARGLAEALITRSPYGDSRDAIDSLVWHPAWDRVIRRRSPNGVTTFVGIDSTNGDRLWEQVGGNDSTRTWYRYDSQRRVRAVLSPKGNAADSIAYDGVLGNVAESISALGFRTRTSRDEAGRVILVQTPTDSAPSSMPSWRRDQTSYDWMGHPTYMTSNVDAKTYALSTGGVQSVPAVSTIVNNYFDAFGLLTGSTRTAPGIGGTATINVTSSYTYDYLGRRVTSREGSALGVDSVYYDAGGWDTLTVTARGARIRKTFDFSGRVLTKTVTGLSDPAHWCACGQADVPMDSVRFPYYPLMRADGVAQVTPGTSQEVTTYMYDAEGRVIQAENPWARVRRWYYPGGALRADTTYLLPYDKLGFGAYGSIYSAHVFGQEYEYDLSGNLTRRKDSTGADQRYLYSATLGALSSVSETGYDPGTFSFAYRADGLLHQWTGPGATGENFDYDGDGRLRSRLVVGAGTPGNGSGIYDVVARDALGRVLNHSDGLYQWTRTVYGSMGAVVALEQERDGVRTKDEMMVDGLGNQLTLVRNRGLDGEVSTTSTYGSNLQINSRNDTPTTRLDNFGLPATRHVESTSYTQYDQSGNTRQTTTSAQDLQTTPVQTWVPAQSGTAWTESWYDGENRLHAYQRTYFLNGGRRTQLAEYRYDPFGRRVMTRTRVDSIVCPNQQLDADCQATMERFYWDGDRLVYEERGSGWDGTIATDLETNVGPNSAYYGAVQYLHGAGLDEPLSMRHSRLGAMVLHRNWRGIVTGATHFNGSGENSVVWPGAYRDAFHAPDLRQQPPAQTGWIGSLAEDQRDVTGLTYRRNRYYDANSGRFTQVDPIGLAGGWNIYGFVGGDPMSYSDPFGLCLDPNNPKCSNYGGAVAFGGFQGSLVFGAGATIAAGIWTNGHSAGPYLRVAGGTGVDVSLGGEMGISTSRGAFSDVSDGACMSVLAVGSCISTNAAGRTMSISAASGTRGLTLPSSMHVERSFTLAPDVLDGLRAAANRLGAQWQQFKRDAWHAMAPAYP